MINISDRMASLLERFIGLKGKESHDMDNEYRPGGQIKSATHRDDCRYCEGRSILADYEEFKEKRGRG